MTKRIACILLSALLLPSVHAAERHVALTIDDLPYQRGNSLAEIQTLTTDLLARIKTHGVPAVGFVNEAKLHEGGAGELRARTALLEQWLDAGLELGNHTYAHRGINEVPFDTYAQDVLRGEQITRELMQKRGMKLRYFRHPYLHAGKDPAVKADLERFLAAHAYTIAPVTIDNDEWIFASAYDKAAERQDRATMLRIGADYLDYMEQCFLFSEDLARQIFGRDIKQILLVHSNALNAEYLDDVIAMTMKRGYEYISVEEAMQDPAYEREDPYVGPKGLSWLLRWGMDKNVDASQAPEVPEYVRQLAGVE